MYQCRNQSTNMSQVTCPNGTLELIWTKLQMSLCFVYNLMKLYI
ncbi:hypothetical protein MtrunA17_Chr8g0358421 [Medicago truncatula]|uniref:Uncharacterized protein n=1 Tax=Medicago truncatula TaxID=3880 RepID=A0A396GKR0_MEDTR|nr:hypothetical protein MtrunA17_Chr8g0358421 [Medicago truncatula]